MAGKPERARFGRQLGRLLRSASPGPETPAAAGDRLRDAAVVAAFFASGVAGLVYEVVWIRKASLVFGSTTYALGTVLAVFFLGLATGSELFGRLSMRIRRPLAVFCALELGVASLALLTLPGFALADELYGVVYRISDGIGATRWLARPVLISLVILPSTLLMGGTLPLLCRHFVRERGRIAGTVALLYGLNTLGATVGCLLAGFVLIPGLGEARSLVFAAGMNVVAALLAVSVRPVHGPGADPMPRQDDGIRSGPRLAIGLLFMAAGFAALGQQVVWTRFLSLVIRNTVYTYTLTLAAVLLGIVIGSLIASRGLDRARSRAGWFGGLQIGFALWVLTLLSLPPAILRPLGDSLAVIFALLLPPAILSGAAFPLAVRMAVDDPLMAGFGAGRMSAVNTLGGVLGSLAVGFLVLPALGLAFALRLTTGVSLLVGVAAWLVLARDTRLFLRAAAAAACVSLWALLPSLTGTRLPADWLTQDGVLVDHREGLEAHVAVVRREDTLVLEIDRAWQGSDGRSHQIVAAHIPALLHPQPRRVLVVGVGAGQTAERFLMHGIAVLDCVEVEPAVFDVLRAHFGGEWLSDRRVRLLRADGRNLLSHGTGRYDILSLELGQIPRHGVASFYTVEFYERARERLEPGGLVA